MVAVLVAVWVGVGVKVSVGVSVAVAVAVSVGVGVKVSVGVSVAVAVGVGVKVSVGVSVAVSVAVAVAVSVGSGVAVAVAVGSGVAVSVGSTVAVAVFVAALVAVLVGSAVVVAVAVLVGVTVSVGARVGAVRRPWPREGGCHGQLHRHRSARTRFGCRVHEIHIPGRVFDRSGPVRSTGPGFACGRASIGLHRCDSQWSSPYEKSREACFAPRLSSNSSHPSNDLTGPFEYERLGDYQGVTFRRCSSRITPDTRARSAR